MTELKKFKGFYRAFREVSKVVHSKSKTDLNEVLKIIVSYTAQGLAAKGAAVCFHKDAGAFIVSASYGIDEKYIALEPLIGKRFFSWPNEDFSPYIITDILNAPRVKYPKEAWDIGIRMMVDVPLIFNNTLLGFIRTYFGKRKTFSPDELDFMNAVTEQCACAINHDSRIKFHVMQYNKLATKIDRLSSLGRMAAGIAHEINNPLTGILLYSSNLFKKADDKDGAFKEGLEIIMQETQRCKTTIQGLLDFSREKKPEKTDANINTVIEKALALMDNEFLIKRIQIQKTLDSDIINFRFDANQIEQVLVNLLLNAIHAINEKGLINIRSRMDKKTNSVFVEIKDNGYGIPQDKLKKIFEPFYTTKADGTGLGLSVSYGIIKNHQGTVDILSELGTGTVITIGLPIMEKAKLV